MFIFINHCNMQMIMTWSRSLMMKERTQGKLNSCLSLRHWCKVNTKQFQQESNHHLMISSPRSKPFTKNPVSSITTNPMTAWWTSYTFATGISDQYSGLGRNSISKLILKAGLSHLENWLAVIFLSLHLTSLYLGLKLI